MKHQIVIEIEAEEKTCGKCLFIETDIDGYMWCSIFNSCLNFAEMYVKRFNEQIKGDLYSSLRCLACLTTEIKEIKKAIIGGKK